MNTKEHYCKHTLYRGIYTDGKLYSHDFVEICKQQPDLNFNINYLNPNYIHKSFETPFREIQFARYDDLISVNDTPPLPVPDLYHKLLKAVKDHFVLTWDDSPKLILHSSGLDSRIMSTALAELRDERGLDWIGDIHFRCHQPEGDVFNEIMKIQKWDQKYYSVWAGPEKDYYDVGNDRYILNGWHNYNQAMNFWSDIVPPEKEKEYTLINGWGGEVFKYLAKFGSAHKLYSSNNALDLMHYSDYREWESLYMCRFKNVLMPFFSHKYLELSLNVPASMCLWSDVEKMDNIRYRILLKSCYPEIAHFKNVGHDYVWNISKDRAIAMYHKWYGSLFYTRYIAKYKTPALDIHNMYGWDAAAWGFMTAYEKIFA